MKTFKLGLLPKLIIGIIIGILLGFLADRMQDMSGMAPRLGIVIMQIYATITTMFHQFLMFSIPLIIMGFLIPGITQIGKNAGRLVGIVVIFAYLLTVSAGVIAYFVTDALSDVIVRTSGELSDHRAAVPPPIALAIPPIMGVITALVLSFVVGIFLTTIEAKAP